MTVLNYKLLVDVTEGSGATRRVTFTFFERDIARLERLAKRYNVNRSVLLRYLIADLDARVEAAKRVQWV